MCQLDQPIVKLNALQALFDLALLFGVQVFGQNESTLDALQRIKWRQERHYSKDLLILLTAGLVLQVCSYCALVM